MSEPAAPRRILYLVLEGLAPARLEEISRTALHPGDTVEILSLTETNSLQALEKIFAADTVAAWGELIAK